jgi:uncharacterized glyoxalase superfamily protein PhnB
MESISPNIFVRDLPATVHFYNIIGFEVVTSVPGDDGEDVFVLMKNGSTTFMFQNFKSIENLLPEVSRHKGGSLLLYIKMAEIRPFFEKLKGQIPILQELKTTFYGATEFSVVDPNNFVLTFAEHD